MKRSWMMLPVLALPLSTAAQRVTITPTAGAYVPLKNQGAWTESWCGSRPPCWQIATSTKVALGPAVGVKLGLEWDRRHAIEGSVITAVAERRTSREIVVSPGDFLGPGDFGNNSQSGLNTFMTLQYRRTWSLSDRTDFTVGLGTSLTKLDGSAYDDLRKQTYFGPIGSLSLATAVGRTKVALSVADAMYSIQYTRAPDGGTQTSYMQHDLLLTAGLQIGGW